MSITSSSIANKAFGENAESALVVAYESHQDAVRFLRGALDQTNAIALLQGPRGSGKSTIVRQLRDLASRDSLVVLVDGYRLTPGQLVGEMLRQFGVEVIPHHDEQKLQTLSGCLADQKSTPLVIVDNADRAGASVLSLLNWLAAEESGGKFSMRIVLTGRERLSLIVSDHSLRNFERRHPATYSLNPLNRHEAMIYLRTRLIAAGGDCVEDVFPADVCDRLYELARGWPGRLNDHALEALARMEEVQDTRAAPRIIVTADGKTLAEYSLTKRESIIGRDDVADIVLKDSFVSKLHAMLQVHDNGVVLLDLNSTNGTRVNSIEKPRTILRDNDIISIGRHRLKLENAPAVSEDIAARIRAADTMILDNIEDIRAARARHNIAAIRRRSSS